MTSLLDLSEDVIIEIVQWLCPKAKEYTPDYCFSQNSIAFENKAFGDLVLLSSTCQVLRRILGGKLFSNVSLVRFNEAQVILRAPKSESVDKEVAICRILHDLLALKRGFTFNNFVQYLEAPVSVIYNNPLFQGQFPRLNALKVYSNGDDLKKQKQQQFTYEAITPLVNLEYMSSNALIIFNVPCLLASVGLVNRLDLLIDLSELTPNTEIAAITQAIEEHEKDRLVELNLFVTSIEALKQQEILSLIIAASPLLEKLTIRTVRKSHLFVPKSEWGVGSVTGNDILGLITQTCKKLKLLAVSDELFTCFQFVLPGVRCRRTAPLHLTYVRRPPTSFAFQGQDNLVAFTVGVGATSFHLLYFETELLRHHNQMDFLLVLLSMVSLEYCYQDLKKVSVENCWSYENDSMMRAKFENQVDNSNLTDERIKGIHRQLAMIHPWTRLALNTPYHKQKEEYSVVYCAKGLDQYTEILNQLWRLMPGLMAMILASSNSPLPLVRPLLGTPEMDKWRRDFWGVETSLLELEHYCLRDRQRSSLWDS
ncbi:uncharacterized protein KQ657_003817 [Scheffersomyces spartinae]|uniref:F-box domain-containing protein n=1 Tax=Scheffersomyces spartinae TaxID=45513 RepID=A0A9P7VD32_9ASCO|nr:uncharacterized protein KQ657_003817 [Scheffersomyces spartinae]KAG7195291.1 hypothetical protein KQ657_003817 [Scheffersomyces spartinae]